MLISLMKNMQNGQKRTEQNEEVTVGEGQGKFLE